MPRPLPHFEAVKFKAKKKKSTSNFFDVFDKVNKGPTRVGVV